MKEVVIVGALRTAQGMLGGTIKDFSATQLGTIVVQGLLEKTKIDPNLVEEVIMGNCLQDTDAPNLARNISLSAKLPIKTTAFTVHRNCASGIQSISSAYQNIVLGDANVHISGGAESMSRAPFVNRDLRFGKKLQHSELRDTLWEALTDPYCNMIMGLTAENLAEEFSISREEQDKYAVSSHNKAEKATKEGKFKDEIVPVIIKSRKGDKVFDADEGIAPGLTLDKIKGAPTVFKKDGTVTPANACPISDGASAVMVMSAEKAKELGLEPLAYVRSYAYAACEPERMGMGPTYSTPVALKKAGLSLKDMELIELNEAFAAQALACGKKLDWDWDKVNVNGGAIALGHPVGCSGTRIVVTLLHEMIKRDLSLGLANLCVGGGMGGSIILERK